MTIKVLKTDFEDLYLIEPFASLDSRGVFSRLYSTNDLKPYGLDFSIAQVNYSTSADPGIIRGLHFQTSPFAEIKLLKVVSGSVYDVVIDLRKGSKTFMKTHCVELSASLNTMILVPKGFAHGMQSLEQDTQVVYFSSSQHSSENEGLIRWNDPTLSAKWPIKPPILSQKDSNSPNIDLENIKTLEF